MIIKPTLRSFVAKRYLAHILLGVVLIASVFLVELPRELETFKEAMGILGLVLVVLPLIHAKLYEMTTKVYTTDDDYIVYEIGILHHHKKKIAINNITDTAISADIIDRLVNTRTLKINTGGSLGYEAEIDDLDKEEAEELHDFLLNRKRNTNPHNEDEKENKA